MEPGQLAWHLLSITAPPVHSGTFLPGHCSSEEDIASWKGPHTVLVAESDPSPRCHVPAGQSSTLAVSADHPSSPL